MTYRAVIKEIKKNSPLPELSVEEQTYCQYNSNSDLFQQRLNTCIAVRELLNLKNAPISRMQNGKPYLINRSETFSVAHKENMIFVGMQNDGAQIGVDLEDEISKRDWRPFHGRFFNHQDWLLSLRLNHIFYLDNNTTMLILFTAKEAFLKCTELEIDPLKMTFCLDNEKSTSHHMFFSSHLNWKNKQQQFLIEIKRQNEFILAVCILTKKGFL